MKQKYYIVRAQGQYSKKFDTESDAMDYAKQLEQETKTHIISITAHLYPDLASITGDNAEIIKKAITDELISETVHRFTSCEWSDKLVTKDDCKFAVFGSFAVKLLDTLVENSDEGCCAVWEPVIIDGKCFSMFPDEGTGGVLHVVTTTKRRGEILDPPKVRTSFFSAGWLHTNELELSAEEIADNIIAEIDRGETPITGGVTGWM